MKRDELTGWESRYNRDTEVADILGVSVATVRRWAKAGVIPQPIKLGTATRWSGAELAKYLELKAA